MSREEHALEMLLSHLAIPFTPSLYQITRISGSHEGWMQVFIKQQLLLDSCSLIGPISAARRLVSQNMIQTEPTAW